MFYIHLKFIYDLNMYIYRLANFKENAYLFTRIGNLVYEYSRYPCFGNNWNNPKTNDYCDVYYFDYKTKKKKHRKAYIKLIKIDFLSIPEEIQSLFYLNGKDIKAIKNSMNSNQWNQFLIKYGEII